MARRKRRRGGRRRARLVLVVVLLLALLLPLARWYGDWSDARARRLSLAERQHLLVAAAARHNADPALVLAVAQQESNFDPDVLGRAGERGMLQVTLGAASDWAAYQHRPPIAPGWLYNPALNSEIGVWYLSLALHQWQHRPDGEVLALVQYNAGRQRALSLAALRECNQPADVPIDSTRAYILNILHYRSQYRIRLEADAKP